MRADGHESVLRGFGFALLAALSFGITTPLVQRLSTHLAPFATAGLLYLGAAAIALSTRQARTREAKLELRHVPRLLGMTLAGAVLAPAALAWGLQRTSGVSAGLALNFEAVFTAFFGYAIAREHVGRRAAAALFLMCLAGALLVMGRAEEGSTALLGMAAILTATAGWGLDNALSNGLAGLDPGQVVFTKCALGALVSLLLAWAAGASIPPAELMLGLLALGATGYGLSLRLYLLAQRRIGAARTASIFGAAPFIAAILAALLGERLGGASTAGALVLMVAGLALHLTERHGHRHTHDALMHEHAHRHDDGHHDHRHSPPFVGEHSHAHQHLAREHDHPHMPDAHHGHRHS